MVARWTMLLSTSLLALLSLGCGGRRRFATPTSRDSVPILVLRHAGAARILVRVKIDGRPFAMVVDTGAAKTAISAGVASALDLPAAGSPIIGQTFGCRVRSQPVLLTDWRLDQRALPATAAEAHVMPTARRVDGLRVAGSLGSDVLSEFGTVTLNFARDRMVLGRATPARGAALPMRVDQDLHGQTYETIAGDLRGHHGDWLVDTGDPRSLISTAVARRLRLPLSRQTVLARGAANCRVRVRRTRISGLHAGRRGAGERGGVWAWAKLTATTPVMAARWSRFTSPYDA